MFCAHMVFEYFKTLIYFDPKVSFIRLYEYTYIHTLNINQKIFIVLSYIYSFNTIYKKGL